MKYFEAKPITEFKDADGKTPEILIVDGNRTGGKTTAFSRLLVEEFLNHGKKFFLVYRFKSYLKNTAETFFKDIQGLFFEGHVMTCKSNRDNGYVELFLDKKPCGYAGAVSMVSKLKLCSHVFNDVENMFFDEYQDENGVYLSGEVKRLMSLHTTIARGKGQAVRFVPLYMCSNSISVFNPYYKGLGITAKITSRTKVYRGNGFVLLRLTIKDVAEAQRESAFNRAFSSCGYLESSIDNSFLNDDDFNVERRAFNGSVSFTFIFASDFYSVLFNNEEYYVKRGGDKNIKPCFGVNHNDRGKDVKAIYGTTYYKRLKLEYENATIHYESIEAKHAFQCLIMV